ncbi:LETM2 protein, partial [Rhodinocichla rosea]|nr:LETM2 protein [Rhodinocichla rosea]
SQRDVLGSAALLLPKPLSSFRGSRLLAHCSPPCSPAAALVQLVDPQLAWSCRDSKSQPWARRACLPGSPAHALHTSSSPQQQLPGEPHGKPRNQGAKAAKSLAKQVVAPAGRKSLRQRVVDELKHYYHGFHLLWIDTKVAARMVWRLLHGQVLTRRERRRVTLSQPFSQEFPAWQGTPFTPWNFQWLLNNSFTVTFTCISAVSSRDRNSPGKKGKGKRFPAGDLTVFCCLQQGQEFPSEEGGGGEVPAGGLTQLRALCASPQLRPSGQQPSTQEIVRFSKLFEDELTLEHLERPQLVALCKLLELQPLGTNNLLRFQLLMRLRSIKADDEMIAKEGVSGMSVAELQSACRARGMRSLGLSEEQLKEQLGQWLDLHLKENIPSSLLLLSRALYLINVKPQSVPIPQSKATAGVMTSVLEGQETLLDPAPVVQGRKTEEFVSQPTEKLPFSEASVKPPPREVSLSEFL